MEKNKYSEERIDLIVGIITVVAVLALFAWLLISVGHRSRTATGFTGEITALGETRRGSEQVFTFNPEQAVAEGSRITWTINGERVYEGSYEAGEAIELAYTPQETGTLNILATAGNYKQMICVDVLAPKLTVSAPNVTVTYGDELPEMRYNITGFVSGEDVSDFCYEGKCVTNADKLNVGVYDICLDKECSYRDYEMEYVNGKLTVLPRTLSISNEISKVYDSCTAIENPELKFANVVEGDEVCAQMEKLYFDNKNAGCDKMIMLGNVELVGENACNYVLPDFVYGSITPKEVEVVGLTVKNKMFDGTTKATIDTMGTLSGVCSGDSVAIGSIKVSFEDAGVGAQNIVANGVTLIGADKDNYCVREIQMPSAEIRNTATFWDKLLEKEPVALGNN